MSMILDTTMFPGINPRKVPRDLKNYDIEREIDIIGDIKDGFTVMHVVELWKDTERLINSPRFIVVWGGSPLASLLGEEASKAK